MRGSTNGKTNHIRNWQNIIGIALLLLATVVIVVFLLGNIFKAPLTSRSITITGITVCLPHKGSGPYTLECIVGLRGDDGRYYALSGYGQTTLDTNISIEATGVLSEPAPNEIYDIAGVIDVSSLKK